MIHSPISIMHAFKRNEKTRKLSAVSQTAHFIVPAKYSGRAFHTVPAYQQACIQTHCLLPIDMIPAQFCFLFERFKHFLLK